MFQAEATEDAKALKLNLSGIQGAARSPAGLEQSDPGTEGEPALSPQVL